MSVRHENEDQLLRWLRQRLAKEKKADEGFVGAAGDGAIGELLGDDAAKIACREDLAITMDTQIEGVHFFQGLPAAQVAERALAVNLSDLAAMGAAPRYAFVSLTSPPHFDRRAFFRALLRAARSAGLRLAGGDLSSASHVQVVITLLGARQGRFLERSGATPGEVIYVGGEVGVSGLGYLLLSRGARLEGRRLQLPAGLEKRFSAAARKAIRRHLGPIPQLALGTELAKLPGGGALDISDGLAKDLHRLCRESGVGARITAEMVPMPLPYRRLAERLGTPWQDLAQGGGEDYVLLFTLAPEIPPPAGAVAIGKIIRGSTVSWIEKGRSRPLPSLGFDHFTRDTNKKGGR